MYKCYNLETIIARAEQGEAEFQYRLGRHHLARTQNYSEAMKWLNLAANQGDVSAMIDLGGIYLRDKYGVKDLDKAEQYFQKASELGGTEAMNKIGGAYYGVRNYNEAIKWFKASNNYSRLGDFYFHGYGFDQNYEEAFKCYLKAKAHYKLGTCYLYGYGVDQNYDEAFKSYLASGDKDMLGECYLHGWGVERNVNKTIELWEAATEERCRYYDVMLKLGHLYGDGIEMEPNYEKALNWWYQLAENDSGEFGQEGAWAEAMYQLACYYYEGKGVKKSMKWALKYFKYTIDLFYDKQDQGRVWWTEYNRDKHAIELISHKIEGDITISDEPDFIIHARKVLVKHGCKSVINKTKKAAQNGDETAIKILKEFGIEFVVPVVPETVVEEAEAETVLVEVAKREPPIELTVGEIVTHRIFGEGCVCEAEDGVVYVEFPSVGKKKFLNPEAFYGGYLSLARLI